MTARRSDRFQLAVQCALILFCCASFIGTYVVWRQNPGKPIAYFLAIGIPAFAGSVFVVLTMLVPNLLAVGSIRFPLNLTLPVVYTALLLCGVVLWTTPTQALTTGPELLAFSSMWRQPGLLVGTAFVQFCALSLLAMLRR